MYTIYNPALKSIWEDRYQKNGETLDGNFRRVAKYIAKDDIEEEEYYNIISNGLFFPAGRTMSNCGIGENLTLNNCFVAPQIQDDLKAIFDAVKLGAITHKSGGGIGYDFSLLRPEGTSTSNDAVASGPVSFMEVFNAQTSTILQGNRRGANMGVINIYHPDIMTFISVKSESGKLEHFNLSVMVDDAFMNAMRNDEEIYLHYPVYDECGKILTDETRWTHKVKVKAKVLWDQIMRMAYNTGEPGIFFYDNMNRDNNLWYVENIVCSNPCSEYLAGTVYGMDNPREYGGACNLGSLVLPNFVEKPFTKDAFVNHQKLRSTIKTAVKMLDRIIDINKFPDKIYENYQKKFRTIGMGVTGLADMLVMLNYKYSSKEACDFVDDIMDKIAYYAYDASVDLAEKYGAFEAYNDDFLQSGYITKKQKSWGNLINRIKSSGIRNARILSIAPCGTMSLTFGNNCSSGIEPIFSLEYDRKVRIGGQSEENIQIVKVRDYAYDMWLKCKDSSECIVAGDMFETALNLSVDEHIDMLSVIAKHIDMSVSKTINIPTDYSFEDTKDVYLKCWSNKIKGCTIFRPNKIRQGVLISDSSKEENSPQKCDFNCGIEAFPRGYIIDPSDDLIGYKRKLNTGCGSIHLEVYADEVTGEPQETFINIGSSGGCERNYQFISRLISLALRAGVPIESIVDQAMSIRPCIAYINRTKSKGDTSPGTSCPSAIGYALQDLQDKMCDRCTDDYDIEEYYENNNIEVKQEIHTSNNMSCPECGSKLQFEGGCVICKGDENHPGCGWSRCD